MSTIDARSKISIVLVGAAIPTAVWVIFWISGVSFKADANANFIVEQKIKNEKQEDMNLKIAESLARIETKLGIVKEK